ncbi:MAG: hypothetical protein COA32_11250 [Fluviicola sp.]|nr:MAG: hypothetical protein COA32_11250 [Fluviicola sp.]
MSKEDKHIDNLFQEKLSDRSFDGPPADFLADLNERLDAKPVVSKGRKWILFLNLFFIGLFVADATIDFSTTRTAEVEQLTSKEKSFKNENAQKENASIKSDDAEPTNSTERFSNTSVTPDESGTNKAKSNTSESNEIEENQANKQTKESNDQADAGVNDMFNYKTQNKNQGESSKNNFSGSKEASNSSTDSKKDDSTKKNNTSINKGDEVAAKDKTAEKEAENTSSDKNNPPKSYSESLSSYVSYSAIYAPQFEKVDRKIKTNDFPEFPKPWNELVADDNNDKSKNPPKQDENTRMFELQLHGGATQWNYKTLGTNDNYVYKIDAAGTPKWTPNFGLGFNVNFNNISIGAGLNYAKFETENLFEFSEVNSYDSTYVAGYDENVTYDTLGNPIDTTYTPYYDSTTVTDTTYSTTSITNQYEWIQIPIHFGYRFNLNKWAIIPRVGMNIGLGIRQSSGQYPNETYDQLQTFSPVKWHLNLHTSLEIRREFGNWHAFGKFNYQRNFTPTIDNALFERKFNGVGFSFGVGYSF